MEQRQLRELLERVAAGETAVDEAEQALRIAPFTELGYATVDNHRGMRQGVSEVVYGAGKTAEQIAGVCRALVENGQERVLVTRLDAEKAAAVERALEGACPLGNEAVRLYDVGVAGIHRLLAHADDIARASVVVAVAGMEGALASVVGGLASCPVIAVPTSVGYGASFGGVAALLAMLNSCASGVSVVNIDNGFGAGYQAHMINHVKARTA